MHALVASPSVRDALAAALAAADSASRRRTLRAALRGEAIGDAAAREAFAAARDVAPEIARTLADRGWSFTAAGEAAFPERVTALSDPPIGLFHRGPLPDGKAVAIVGSRRSTAYGREVAEHLGHELAAAGVWVVSGMARGVDAAAHRGAVAAGGPTAAVWGTGPDRVYPAEHRQLAEEIASAGSLVTEFPPGTAPLPHHFPARNRIIAGLVDVVVVVEAAERSGALITARLALDEGRDVMAVPGSVFSRHSAGPNGLIRSGAAPVLQASDILDVVGVSSRTRAAADDEVGHGLLEAIPGGEAVTVDHLAARLGWPVARVAEELFHLEIEGRVVREADGRYRRRRVSSP